MAKQNLNAVLQEITNNCYQKGCNHLGIVSYRKPIFKGFYHQKLLDEIINNEEIRNNLQITNKELFARYVYDLPDETAGTTWPLNKESWITLNNYYEDSDDFLETLCHETAHAILFNIDIEEGHSTRHKKLTKYLITYYHEEYDLKELEKLL